MAKANLSQFDPVSAQFVPGKVESEILAYWDTEKIFEKSLTQRKEAPLFTFYDGPPYATGKPHYGHILQSALKDTVLRYKTMRGYSVPRRVGWDTHGLPVEVLVEKELGFRNKKDIEAYGIEKFNQKCRETVFRYIDLWVATLKRLGRWADYEHGYATLDRNYMESEWWVFKQLWDKDLVYKDFRSTPYCIRCGTPLSNYEAGEAYKDRVDLAVYVRLKVSPTSPSPSKRAGLRGANQELSLLIWTTTPWTLPANVAVAVSKNLTYVSVSFEGEEYIVAKERAAAIFGEEAKIVREWTLEGLKELTYEPLYAQKPETRNQKLEKLYGVVEAEHVTAEEGTGLVHMAPAFGPEDQKVAKANDLPVLRAIDAAGLFNVDVPIWGGMHIFKANPKIAADLKQRGLLFREEQYTHSYPHCWRCDEPLIYYALDTWFVKVAELKASMMRANEDITWIPEHLKAGRFGKGIEAAPDWAISRNRFWSVPMPIWECDSCSHRVCVGSIEELQSLSGADDTQVQDIHRPYVDDITWACEKCKTGPASAKATAGEMRRISEVLDVWFDSGSMPYSQWHYPFENKEIVEQGFPADFIVESIEMTRAWFYVLHVLAVALKDAPAYTNVIGSGIIFGEDGNKLSKKLKNYPEPAPTIEKYGADTMRMFFLRSTLGEPYVFSEAELQQLYRSFTMRLWNVYSFFIGYVRVAGWRPPQNSQFPIPNSQTLHVLDRWILARLKQLENEVITQADGYHVDNAARAFGPFVDDLSNWYVRRSRQRFQALAKEGERNEALATLYGVLVRLTKLLAPFMPFVTETIYRNLTQEVSVHLADLKDSDEVTSEESALLAAMQQTREIVTTGLQQRAAASIKVRQVLTKIEISGVELAPELTDLIAAEVNVKEAVTGPGDTLVVKLVTDLTPELKQEGMARDIIRQGQVLRRKAGYQLDDKIELIFETEDEEANNAFEMHTAMILAALQAKHGAPGKVDAEAEVKIAGQEVRLGVRKV